MIGRLLRAGFLYLRQKLRWLVPSLGFRRFNFSFRDAVGLNVSQQQEEAAPTLQPLEASSPTLWSFEAYPEPYSSLRLEIPDRGFVVITPPELRSRQQSPFTLSPLSPIAFDFSSESSRSSPAALEELPITQPNSPEAELPITQPNSPEAELPNTQPNSPEAELPITQPNSPEAELPNTQPNSPEAERTETQPEAELPITQPNSPEAEQPNTQPEEEQQGSATFAFRFAVSHMRAARLASARNIAITADAVRVLEPHCRVFLEGCGADPEGSSIRSVWAAFAIAADPGASMVIPEHDPTAEPLCEAATRFDRSFLEVLRNPNSASPQSLAQVAADLAAFDLAWEEWKAETKKLHTRVLQFGLRCVYRAYQDLVANNPRLSHHGAADFHSIIAEYEGKYVAIQGVGIPGLRAFQDAFRPPALRQDLNPVGVPFFDQHPQVRHAYYAQIFRGKYCYALLTALAEAAGHPSVPPFAACFAHSGERVLSEMAEEPSEGQGGTDRVLEAVKDLIVMNLPDIICYVPKEIFERHRDGFSSVYLTRLLRLGSCKWSSLWQFAASVLGTARASTTVSPAIAEPLAAKLRNLLLKDQRDSRSISSVDEGKMAQLAESLARPLSVQADLSYARALKTRSRIAQENTPEAVSVVLSVINLAEDYKRADFDRIVGQVFPPAGALVVSIVDEFVRSIVSDPTNEKSCCRTFALFRFSAAVLYKSQPSMFNARNIRRLPETLRVCNLLCLITTLHVPLNDHSISAVSRDPLGPIEELRARLEAAGVAVQGTVSKVTRPSAPVPPNPATMLLGFPELLSVERELIQAMRGAFTTLLCVSAWGRAMSALGDYAAHAQLVFVAAVAQATEVPWPDYQGAGMQALERTIDEDTWSLARFCSHKVRVKVASDPRATLKVKVLAEAVIDAVLRQPGSGREIKAKVENEDRDSIISIIEDEVHADEPPKSSTPFEAYVLAAMGPLRSMSEMDRILKGPIYRALALEAAKSVLPESVF